MKNHVKRTDSLITCLKETRKEILTNYIDAFSKRLLSEISDYTIDANSLISDFRNELKYLKTDEKLTKLTIRFMAKNLAIPHGSKLESEKAKFNARALYYDTRVRQKPPKHPSLEFTKKIGKN